MRIVKCLFDDVIVKWYVFANKIDQHLLLATAAEAIKWL